MWGLGGCVGDWAGDGLGWGGRDKKFQSSACFKNSARSDLMKKSKLAKKGRLPIRSLN